MKQEKLFFEDWVIREYLRSQEDRDKTKNVELLIALALNKFCERQFSEKCWIGLEIKEKYANNIPASGFASLDEIGSMINKMTEENTPVDISIGIKPTKKETGSKGVNFQIKRFGKDANRNTCSLINFLNGIKNKYSSSKTSLVVIMETPEEIDLQEVSKSLNINGYLFQKIILISALEGKINFYGIWPESGWSRFDPVKMEFDF